MSLSGPVHVHCAGTTTTARPRVRAVVFDFYGTLTAAVTRGPQHAETARLLGCDPAAFVAVLDRSFRTRSRGVLGTPAAALRWVCDQLGVDPPPDVLREALRHRVVAVRADTRLRPDAVATLTAARARRLATAVVSDCSYELPEFWPALPVAPLVDAAVFSVEVGACKPDPAIYQAACRRLGVSPAECLYIGDGGGEELTGAAALGMHAVRLAAADLTGHLVYRPDLTFTGPAAGCLPDAVRFLDHLHPPAESVAPVAALTAAPPAPPVPAYPGAGVPSRP